MLKTRTLHSRWVASIAVALLCLPAAAALAGGEDCSEDPQKVKAKVVHKVAPDYPEEARKEKLQAVVVVKIHVENDGTVGAAEVASGPEVFHPSALDAVHQWRFEPTPEGFDYEVTINYRLDKDGEPGKEGAGR